MTPLADTPVRRTRGQRADWLGRYLRGREEVLGRDDEQAEVERLTALVESLRSELEEARSC